MSARAPAGRINRKNGSVVAVDISERSNVDGLVLFIIQVAAVSCAATQVPEATVANQSLLKVGFCKALQLEVLVIRIEGSSAAIARRERLTANFVCCFPNTRAACGYSTIVLFDRNDRNVLWSSSVDSGVPHRRLISTPKLRTRTRGLSPSTRLV
jgi:hypothetical protein